MSNKKINKCEVCHKNESIGVACVPGVPYSASYCKECLQANAHPIFILLANTSCIGKLDECADWWQQMVKDTCKHLNYSIEIFNQQVEEQIKETESMLDHYERTK